MALTSKALSSNSSLSRPRADWPRAVWQAGLERREREDRCRWLARRANKSHFTGNWAMRELGGDAQSPWWRHDHPWRTPRALKTKDRTATDELCSSEGSFTAYMNWTELNSSSRTPSWTAALRTNWALTVLVSLQPITTKYNRDADARDQWTRRVKWGDFFLGCNRT